MRGVEPLSLAWKAKVIPIYDTRVIYLCRGAENRTQAVRSQSARTTIIRHPDKLFIYLYYSKNVILSKEDFHDKILINSEANALVVQWIE